MLNGSYGAFAAPYFILYNNHVAGTITAEGRELTKSMDRVNEDYWYNQWHLDTQTHKKMHIRNVEAIDKSQNVSIYGDSVSGDSVIHTEAGKFTIEELWNMTNSESIRGDKEVLPADFNSLNWTESNGLHFAPVKNIIRHKTSKPKWRIKAGGSELLVTGDHSLVVFRNGVQITVKPKGVISGDRVLITR